MIIFSNNSTFFRVTYFSVCKIVRRSSMGSSTAKMNVPSQEQKQNDNQTNHKVPNVVSFEDSIRGALFGLYVGDALAMPVHWYYSLGQLSKDFPKGIYKYEKSVSVFPGSIMNLSNTGGGGRGSDKGTIIGDVINHGKKKYWKKGGNIHYHFGLECGENTLDAQITKLLTNSIIKNKFKFNKFEFLKDYTKFMTTPNSHNDVYASTAHRMFFANYIKYCNVDKNDKNGENNSKNGKFEEWILNCPDDDGHNVAAIDMLINVSPVVIIEYLRMKKQKVSSVANINSNTTNDHDTGGAKAEEKTEIKDNSKNSAVVEDVHGIQNLVWKDLVNSLRNVSNSNVSKRAVYCYVELLCSILDYRYNSNSNSKDNKDSKEESKVLEELIVTIGKKYNFGVNRYDKSPMVACYIDSSFEALLTYGYYNSNNCSNALFASANGGGENVARGSCLGSIMGAFYGYNNGFVNHLKTDLIQQKEINQQIDDILKHFDNPTSDDIKQDAAEAAQQ